MDDDAIQVHARADAGPVQIKIPRLYLTAQGVAGLLLCSSQQIRVKSLAVQKHYDRNRT
jgi:hypothetical protein